jgi:NADH-quinone oxidoreductase subunit H
LSWKRLLLQLLAACAGLYLAYAYLLRLERRALARLPLRGERRWGVLWPLVDAIRALGKKAGGGLLRRWALLGPLVGLGLALTALCLLPVGPDYVLAGKRLWAPFSRYDPDPLTLALMGLAPALGTWLMGQLGGQAGVREGSLAVAGRALVYSVPALLALAGAALVAGEFGVNGLVLWQHEGLPLAVYQPLGLLLVALSGVLAGRRLPAPDDVPQPALLDFHLQHAGSAWALSHLVEYLGLFYNSTVIALVYLAGWGGPASGGLPWLVGKTLAVMLALLWLRQRWYTGWRERLGPRTSRLLLALGVANLLVTAVALWWRVGR